MGAPPGSLSAQRGSILIIVVLVMLAFGVIGVSFVLLASLENQVGLNQKGGAQALAVAEAALEHGRDRLRELAGTPPNFNQTTLVQNASDGSMLLTDVALGDGTYSVRIDNDCGTAIVPASVPATQKETTANCTAHNDGNERVVLTAWATSGSGRARVRAWVGMSNPWTHVCYTGDGTLCTQESNANQNATISPNDPNAFGGPATGSLPVPDPNNRVCGAAIRHPAGVTFGATDCVLNPYYDRALDTPCSGCSPARVGCYGHTGLVGDLCPDSGLAFYGPSANLLHGASVKVGSTGGSTFQCAGDHAAGSTHPGCPVHASCVPTTTHCDRGVVVYVLGKLTLSNNGEVNGTVVVHGDDVGGTVDVDLTGQSGIWTVQPCWPTNGGEACGYPMALFIYDPAQGAPPQNTSTHMSNSNSEIHGLIYSAGTVAFDPIHIDGSIVSWTNYLHTASASATYNPTYGTAAPPPGFSALTGSQQTMAIDPRTWRQCKLYSTTESAAPTSCN